MISYFGITSFRTQLVLGVVLTVASILAVSAIQDISSLEKRIHKEQNDHAQLIVALVGDALVPPLWDFNIPHVEELIAIVLKAEGVGQVQLIGPSGSPIVEAKNTGFQNSISDLVVVRGLTFEIEGTPEELGHLVVRLPTGILEQEVQAAILKKVSVLMSIIATVSASLFFVLSKLTSPLRAFVEAIKQIKNGNLKISIPAMTRRDEIGKMAQALDLLRQNEAEVQGLRALNDERSRRETGRIRFALESTRDAVVVIDEAEQIVFYNSIAQDYFGKIKFGTQLTQSRLADATFFDQVENGIRTKQDFNLSAFATSKCRTRRINLLIRGGPIRGQEDKFLGTLVLATDNTEQVRQEEKVRFFAEHDSLTGLPNRRLMEKTLKGWQDEGFDTSILLGDLDHFKLINDTLGHPVGDALLIHIADLIRNITKGDDLAIRLGGDEFAIISNGEFGSNRLKNYAIALIGELNLPQTLDGNELHTGLSAGIASTSGTVINTSDLLRRADLALYEAKRNGRRCVELFRDELEANVKRKSELASQLRRALKSGGVYPVFQMQTDTKTQAIVGFEALARWEHATLGPISPAEFIPVAEETGQIKELTYQILIESCRTAAEWRKLGFEGRVAVNVSAKLFGFGVAEFINDCLFITGCPADAIEVEITETVVLANETVARAEIEAIKELGITIALDDFGMGYSSLSYLQRFPVDKIKIDREFVSRLPDSVETKAIVVAIIELGHALGMKVVGEGAETERHRKELRDCKADTVQGFVDGTPMNKHDALATFQRNSRENKKVS